MVSSHLKNISHGTWRILLFCHSPPFPKQKTTQNFVKALELFHLQGASTHIEFAKTSRWELFNEISIPSEFPVDKKEAISSNSRNGIYKKQKKYIHKEYTYMYSIVRCIYYVHMKYSIFYTYQLSSLHTFAQVASVKKSPRPWLLGPNKAWKVIFSWSKPSRFLFAPVIFSMGGDRGKKRNWRDFHLIFFYWISNPGAFQIVFFFFFVFQILDC